MNVSQLKRGIIRLNFDNLDVTGLNVDIILVNSDVKIIY